MDILRSASNGAQPLAHPQASIHVSEFPLNRYQSFRAEILTRDGKSVVCLSRWKNTPAGARRTGQCLEFGAHRTTGVAKLLRDVQDALKSLSIDGGAA